MKIRQSLRNCEPYFIEYDLLSKLYLKEDEEKTEYWIFFYYFVRRLNYEAIGVRLGYTYNTVYYKLNNILKANKTIIEEFITQRQSNKN